MTRIKCFFVEDTGRYEAFERRDDAGDLIASGERPIWKRTDTGEEFNSLGDLPAGAMWFADWLDDLYQPQLDHVLVVKTPGGDWVIDSQASNCTMPAALIHEDGKEYHPKKQVDHHCWIIHGSVPEITVDKNGVTCGAGAGSIATSNGKYHGFLRNGYLEEC